MNVLGFGWRALELDPPYPLVASSSSRSQSRLDISIVSSCSCLMKRDERLTLDDQQLLVPPSLTRDTSLGRLLRRLTRSKFFLLDELRHLLPQSLEALISILDRHSLSYSGLSSLDLGDHTGRYPTSVKT
jgi:hypothetical protein